MKQLTWRLVLPVTLMVFFIFTRWWYVFPVDARDVYCYGFPFIYKCQGFHTSMSTQYFLIEALVDILIYFAIIYTLIWFINKYRNISIPRKLSSIFWIGFVVFFSGFIFLSIELNDIYLIKRDFDVDTIDKGFTIFESNSKDWVKPPN